MVASNKRVLIVDDESIVCESYKAVLTDEGYSVRTALNGRDALAACRSERFDVVLADLKMPDMDGLEVTRELKRKDPQVQVLIITGYPTQQSAEQARRLGVFDYLSKPLSPDRLSSVTAAAAASPVERTVPVQPAVAPAAGEDELATAGPGSVATTLGMLALAPLIGLAYVMFLPILGFGMIFGVLGSGLAKKLGWARG
jgi:DNA-binding NtrC family response regulator